MKFVVPRKMGVEIETKRSEQQLRNTLLQLCLAWHHSRLSVMSLSGDYSSVVQLLDHSFLHQSEFTLCRALINLSTLLII